MKKALTLVLLLLLLIPATIADGGIWRPDNWEPLEQNEQRAAIAYQDGLEKMIIAVDFSMASEKAVWIFPVPAKPQKVVIDVVTEFPTFRGRSIEGYVQAPVKDAALSIVYPFFIPRLTIPTEEIYRGGIPFEAGIGGVTVHEHLEKEGVTVELVTAESGDALYDYLSSKGLNVQKSAISIFDSYVGKEYSFVVSWVSSSVQNRSVPSYCASHYECSQACSISCPPYTYGCCVNGNIGQCNSRTNQCFCQYSSSFCSGCPPCDYTKEYCDGITKTCKPKYYGPVYQQEIELPYYPYRKKIGVFLTFPTDKVFYPLMPTSVYGSKSIPIKVYLVGYFAPKLYQEIKSFAKTSYYLQDYLSAGTLENFFGSANPQNIPYTQLEMNVPSKYFVEDLWFEKSSRTEAIQFFVSHKTTVAFILVVITSVIAGSVTGFIVYREIKKFALIGLANVLTVVGLSVVLMLTRTEKKGKFEAIDRKKLTFIILFSIVYAIVSLFFYFGLATLV
jgi:hypothetical protein